MFRRTLSILCKESGFSLAKKRANQALSKKFVHLETVERIKEERRMAKKNKVNVIEDTVILKAYQELEAEGFFNDKKREDY
eukprot:gene5789-7200_t